MKEYKLSVDPKILELLGPKLYSNIYYILAELIANSYDACAQNVYLISDEKSITIEDDGFGMSYEQNDIEKYLTVAEETRTSASESIVEFNGLRRRKMGRKGIGKLAAIAISKTVHIQTIKNKEKSGFILTRTVNSDGQLEPIADDKIHFDYITDHGTSVKMFHPEYQLHKTTKSIKKNIVKLLPIIGPDFQIHIVQDNIVQETLESFDNEMISNLACMITIGPEFSHLSNNFEFLSFIKDEEKSEILKDYTYKENLELKPKNSDEKRTFELEIKGWIGAYRQAHKRKEQPDDFPDNFISIIANGKLGEFNILPTIGSNRNMEFYVIGQIHIDLLENSDLPDIATSNRQGYKSDDLRYKKSLQYIRDVLLKDILKMRNEWASIKKSKRDFQINENKLKREQELIEMAQNYKSTTKQNLLTNLDQYITTENKDIVSDEIDNTIEISSELIGLKSEVESATKKVMISHSSQDKEFSQLVYDMLLFNGLRPIDILYTSAVAERESRIPNRENILDYIRDFFIKSYSDKKLFVIYITSENFHNWNPILEAGAGWVANSSFDVFNLNDYHVCEPIRNGEQWQSSSLNMQTNTISMDKKNAYIFCEKIQDIIINLDFEPNESENNINELQRRGVIIE